LAYAGSSSLGLPVQPAGMTKAHQHQQFGVRICWIAVCTRVHCTLLHTQGLTVLYCTGFINEAPPGKHLWYQINVARCK
jgi:hypothetical protein